MYTYPSYDTIFDAVVEYYDGEFGHNVIMQKCLSYKFENTDLFYDWLEKNQVHFFKGRTIAVKVDQYNQNLYFKNFCFDQVRHITYNGKNLTYEKGLVFMNCIFINTVLELTHPALSIDFQNCIFIGDNQIEGAAGSLAFHNCIGDSVHVSACLASLKIEQCKMHDFWSRVPSSQIVMYGCEMDYTTFHSGTATQIYISECKLGKFLLRHLDAGILSLYNLEVTLYDASNCILPNIAMKSVSEELKQLILDNQSIVPETGGFYMWKWVRGQNGVPCIIKMFVPSDAKRLGTQSGRKVRVEYAKTISAEEIHVVDGKVVLVKTTTMPYFMSPLYATGLMYHIGEMTKADSFEDDRNETCRGGIHGFMNKSEAIAFAKYHCTELKDC